MSCSIPTSVPEDYVFPRVQERSEEIVFIIQTFQDRRDQEGHYFFLDRKVNPASLCD